MSAGVLFRPRSVLSGLFLLGLVNLATAEVPERIEVHQPLPSTAMIFSRTGPQQVMQGSGFLVDRAERLLLTNHHVARTDQEIAAFFPVYDMGMVLARRDFYLKKAPFNRGKCLVSEAKIDLALLQLEALPVNVPEVKLAAQRPKLDDRVHLLGNPGNHPNLWIYGSGKVQGVNQEVLTFADGSRVLAKTLRIVTHDRTLGPGASGGPVVNDRGELIGVIQSGSADAGWITCIDVSEVRVFLGAFYRQQATEALRKRQYPEVVTRASKALTVHPEDALAYNERGAAYAFQERWDEAIADYGKALRLNPNLTRTWHNRATAYYLQGKYEEAVADCTEAIQRDGQYAQAYWLRGKALGKLGKASAAQADYQTARRLDPSLP